MEDLVKVNGKQLLAFWKNLSVGLAVLIGVILLSNVLPHYFSPVIALIGAAFLYTMIYNNRLKKLNACIVIPYALFYCIIAYSIISIVLNILYIWDIIDLPITLTFFQHPYIPPLLLDPICALTLFFFYFRKNNLKICVDCKFVKGLSIDRGRLGQILHRESKLQLLNLMIVFWVLTVLVWGYYLIMFDTSSTINSRDAYMFFWLNLLVLILDELYFAARYYNIYLDLKENGDIISEEELKDMTAKTYLRFYVVCGDSIYLNPNIPDPKMPYHNIIDTPFITKRNANGIEVSEVKSIIGRMTDVKDGKLRFFFGRRNPDLNNHSILRYFYFLDGKPSDYPELRVAGEWIEFNRLKTIYTQSPTMMAPKLLGDISRMTTIILTQKIFDSKGFRKVKVKSYQPTYNLDEVREKDYDFQDDKWIKISMFNSDSKGFYMRRIWKKMIRGNADLP